MSTHCLFTSLSQSVQASQTTRPRNIVFFLCNPSTRLSSVRTWSKKNMKRNMIMAFLLGTTWLVWSLHGMALLVNTCHHSRHLFQCEWIIKSMEFLFFVFPWESPLSSSSPSCTTSGHFHTSLVAFLWLVSRSNVSNGCLSWRSLV